MIAGRKHLLKAVPHLIFVVNMTHRNGCKTNNRVHGRSYIMGHIGQKGGLCSVGMLRLHECVLQSLCLLFLLKYLPRNLLRHHHNHNIACLIILCHNKRLTHTNFLHIGNISPIVNGHFRIALLKPLFQIIQIHHGRILRQRLRRNKLFPLFKTLRSLARHFQSCLFQQRNLIFSCCLYDIMFYTILCQVKFKITYGPGGNGNPILPFFAVCVGHFHLNPQFLLLNLRNVLPDKQCLAGCPIFSLKTNNIYMFPFRFVTTNHMTFKTKIVLFLHCLHNRIPGKALNKFLTLLLFRQNRPTAPHKIHIASPYSHIALFRRGTCQILICIRIQIYHDKAGKQRVDTIDNVPHLPVFLL